MAKLKILFLFIAFVFPFTNLYSDEPPQPSSDSIMITTFYPSPYGVYNQFETHSKTILATNDTVTDPDARVGIGTMNPRDKLEVNGKARADDFCLNSDPTGKCLRRG